MALKLTSRRKSSKAFANQQDLSLKRSSSNASNKSRNAEPTLLYKDPAVKPDETRDETRDERNPMARLFDDASSVISDAVTDAVNGAVIEAASMANDVQMIIAADVDDVSTLGDTAEDKSVVEPQSETKNVRSDSDTLARLIKDLRKKEMKMDVLGQEYVKAREDVILTRQRIKVLSEKIQLEAIANNNRDGNREGSAVETISAAISRIEKAATSVIFPLGELTV